MPQAFEHAQLRLTFTTIQIGLDHLELGMTQSPQLQLRRTLITQASCCSRCVQGQSQTIYQSFVQLGFYNFSLRLNHPFTS